MNRNVLKQQMLPRITQIFADDWIFSARIGAICGKNGLYDSFLIQFV